MKPYIYHSIYFKLITRLLFVSILGNIFWQYPTKTLASEIPPGTAIRNTANGSFVDVDDTSSTPTVFTVQSNEVVVTVAEVAGVNVTSAGVTGTLIPGNTVFFDFRITNVGNDPTRFFIPGVPSSITNGTAGTITVIEYDPDGTGTTAPTAISADNTVPGSGADTGTITGIPNNGSIPVNGTLLVRIPVTIATNPTGNNVSVTLGNTNPANGQNVVYVNEGNDLYTIDNTGTANGDTTGDPVNGDSTFHRQEASASQTEPLIFLERSDAPSSYSEATHQIVNTLKIGANIDSDSTSLASANADGDDTNGTPDDEDGITLSNPIAGATSYSIPATNINVTNTSSSTATLHAWIDFNKNGTFESNEYASTTVNSGTNGGNPTAGLTWSGITVGAAGNTFARFRLTTDGSVTSATSSGSASDGEVEDYQIAIASSISLPPNDSSAQFCPAPTSETNFTNYRIAWTYNVPSNTLLPDHQPWPNKQFDATQIASAPAQVIGSGMTYSFDSTRQTVIHLEGVNQSDATSAYANGDYIEYQFTTKTTMDLERLFNGLAFARHSYTQNYKIAILLSKDNFATATTLVSDYTVTPSSSGAYQWTPIATNLPTHLQPNTTYKFRILFYGATNASAVYWDDFHVSMGGCQDFSDAPTTSYGAANHGIPPVIAHYLGVNKPDAESAVRDGGDAGVNADGDDAGGNTPDDEDGVVIPSLQQGSPATVDVKVNGAGGYLQAWFDWNGDSNFTTSGEQVATNIQDGGTGDLDGVVNGTIQLAVNVPANATTTQTYARFRWSSTQNLNPTNKASDGEVEDYQVAIASLTPKLLLVKRITAINGNTTENPNDSTKKLNQFVDGGTNNDDDNHPYWATPSTYLIGEINAGLVKPGDEVEYTIYFLNTMNNSKSVKICDLIPQNQTFVPAAYNSASPRPLDSGSLGTDTGIALGFSSTSLPTNPTFYLTNIQDTATGDRGRFYAPGDLNTPNTCKKFDGAGNVTATGAAANTDGAVVVDVATGTDIIPPATGAGTPANSYGFIRFRANVK